MSLNPTKNPSDVSKEKIMLLEEIPNKLRKKEI
jgi:hypothetical protein